MFWGECHKAHVEEVRGQPEGVSFLYHMDPRPETQVVWLDGSYLYLLSHLHSPHPAFYVSSEGSDSGLMLVQEALY